MTDEPETIFTLLNKIRYDTTAIQAKVTDALTMLGRMNLPTTNPPTHTCPHAQCGFGFHSEQRLAEHLADVHGADFPARAKPTTGEG